MTYSGSIAGVKQNSPADPWEVIVRHLAPKKPTPLPGDLDPRYDFDCRDQNPELWFDQARFGEAKKICETCPAKAWCLEYALANGEQGVWGGTTPAERRLMKQGVPPGLCSNGHKRTEENTYFRKDGTSIHCRECAVGLREKKRLEKRKERAGQTPEKRNAELEKKRERAVRYREAKRKAAGKEPARWSRWQPWELEIARDPDLTAAEAAAALGRTFKSVKWQRGSAAKATA